MRILIFIIALITVSQAEAQLARESGSYTYHQVVRVTGNKHDLYKKAEEWVSQDHEDSKNVVQYASEDKGQITLRGTFEHHTKEGLSNVEYLCTIQFRNGMYKESFGNFKYVRLNGKELGFENKKLKSKSHIIKDTDMKIAAISNSFKDHMTSKVVASER